ncbi:acetyl-coenzyme A carboxylase carboxyl transferase subunit alpha, partial [Listeria seeligeri FSL S4-171]
MPSEMEFEKPILELKSKIADLNEYNETSDVDLSNEIEKLEKRLAKLEASIYS